MTTIKLIRAEIERRIEAIRNSETDGCEVQNIGKIDALTSLEDFIDSLPAETASPEVEKAANEWLHKWDIDGIPTTTYTWEDMVDCFRAGVGWQKAQMVKIPSYTEMIAAWEKEELPMLREKDFRGDAERMAYNAFLDGWARGMCSKASAESTEHPRLRKKESWISEAKREKAFIEYLRGVFEANNGVENDPDLLIALHGQTLFELAQKDLPDSSDFEAEWKRYTKSRKDDMRTNAVTMNVKEVAKHFAEWGAEKLKKEAVEGYIEGNWGEQEDVPYELYATSDELDSAKFNIGDKVKLIILKEDKV